MHVDKYLLRSDEQSTRFEFFSEGPKGTILKLVDFQGTTKIGVFNLAFGDKDFSTGGIDDLIVSDNGDSEKVLATIVSALYAFFDKEPTAYVYAQGSTKALTRLYRMGINRFFAEMEKDFFLYGRLGDAFEEFRPQVDYEGFLVQRKKVTLAP